MRLSRFVLVGITSGLPVIRPEPRDLENLVSALFGERVGDLETQVIRAQSSAHEIRRKSARSGAHLFFNAASQFVTSVRGTVLFGELVSAIRKRWPSAVTS